MSAGRNSRRRMAMAAGAALLAGLLLAGHEAETRARPLRPLWRKHATHLAVPEARMAAALFLNYRGLAADIYWTRAIQYFGRLHQQRRRHYPLLAPLLRLTQKLDPRLTAAAEFGSYFLADAPPLGAGHPHAAARLLERAIGTEPNDWRLYFDLGFIQALNLHQRRAAAATFAAGARRPGANPVLYTLAADWYGQANEKVLALQLWAHLYRHAPDRLIRENALAHMRRLRAQLDLATLDHLLRQYAAKFHTKARSWQPLIAAGDLRGVPIDPLGHPYRILPDGRAGLSPQTHLTLPHPSRRKVNAR